ncbi:uncharacterized protein [Aquarana catesbeiana]|uniref:uncharacterized protein isoform X4 n=1 Tax=Aquarana catesbeiana TaxID=8400 RepID=UPI003CC99ECB
MKAENKRRETTSWTELWEKKESIFQTVKTHYRDYLPSNLIIVALLLVCCIMYFERIQFQNERNQLLDERLQLLSEREELQKERNQIIDRWNKLVVVHIKLQETIKKAVEEMKKNDEPSHLDNFIKYSSLLYMVDPLTKLFK